MIFNSTVATGDAGNFYNNTNEEVSEKADRSTTLNGYGIIDAYTKTEIDSMIANSKMYEFICNIGFRFLDEPTNVSVTVSGTAATIKWTDPSDLTDSKPVPVTWAGTVVVRNTHTPLNRYDGTEVVDSTTRNEYSVTGYTDSDLAAGTYYYGIFPYDTKGDVRPTKVISVTVE